MKVADADGSGKIEYEEFNRLVSDAQGLHRR